MLKHTTFVILFAFCALCLFPHAALAREVEHETRLEEYADKIMANRNELELTDDQFEKIKAITDNAKKVIIEQNAKIETLTVEINTFMWEAPFNTEEVNPLIAQKYDLKKEKAKYLLKSYVQLKSILSQDQKDKLKSIWLTSKKKR